MSEEIQGLVEPEGPAGPPDPLDRVRGMTREEAAAHFDRLGYADALGHPLRTSVDFACLLDLAFPASERVVLPDRVRDAPVQPSSSTTEHDLKDAIIREMTRAMKFLGAGSDLLGVVCSYGETLEDWEVLDLLKFWNAEGRLTRGG